MSKTQAASKLASLKREPLRQPLRYLIYGPEGVGKSTLAGDAEEPIFFDVEGGSGQLAVARYPFGDGPLAHVPSRLTDIYDALDALESEQHGYRTLVIDTLDALESLVWQHVCDAHGGTKSGINKTGKAIKSIEDFGYGKGYSCALDEFRALYHRIDRLRMARGMSIILLGHSVVRTFKNPLGDDWDRIQLRLHEKAAGFSKEWCDVVGYFAHEEGGGKLDGSDRVRGWHTGRRLLHLQRTAAWDAKTRIPLPECIEVPAGNTWSALRDAIVQGDSISVEALRESIAAELERIADSELSTKVGNAIAKAGDDRPTLLRYLNNLKSRESAQEKAA